MKFATISALTDEGDGYVKGMLYKRATNEKHWHERWFCLHLADRQLRYYLPGKFYKVKGFVDIRLMTECRAISSAEDEKKQKFVFDVTTPSRIYRFAAASAAERESWLRGFQVALESIHLSPVDAAMLGEFTKADKDRSGKLTFSEVRKLLVTLGIQLPTKDVKRHFKHVDGDQNGVLDFGEFCSFLRRLRRRQEVVELFSTVSLGDAVSVAEFHQWLVAKQGHTFMTLKEAKELVETCMTGHATHVQKNDGETMLNVDGFHAFIGMAESATDLVDHTKVGEVYQDMTQPLCNYYIASSHNTYLRGDQVRSTSSAQPYISALRAGCRCVEIDVWDGHNGEPVVTHGGTLTSKVPLVDVVRAIAEHAFATSPFPVILSLENHCSPKQQRVVATMFKAGLGGLLVPPFVGLTSLPSPLDLKNRILIKGKVEGMVDAAQKSIVDDHDDDDDDDDDEPFIRTLPGLGSLRAMSGSIQAPIRDVDVMESAQFETVEIHETMEMREDDTIKMHDTPKKKKSRPTRSGHETDPALAALITLRGVMMDELEGAALPGEAQKPCWYMSSLSETRLDKLSRTHLEHLVAYNQRHLSRVYPKGMRVDSSNMSAIPAFVAGCQLVAMNYQTRDKPMWLYDGFFTNNGGCGYVLKPARWQQKGFDPSVVAPSAEMVLVVEVISGWNLPRDTNGESLIDPYVQVDVYGHPGDKKKGRTKTIKNNGFNPCWRQRFTFPLRQPHLAILMIRVMDEDRTKKDDLIGQRVAPVSCLMPGLRSIYLETEDGQRIPDASILVQITIGTQKEI